MHFAEEHRNQWWRFSTSMVWGAKGSGRNGGLKRIRSKPRREDLRDESRSTAFQRASVRGGVIGQIPLLCSCVRRFGEKANG
jgi:hypothetical protein